MAFFKSTWPSLCALAVFSFAAAARADILAERLVSGVSAPLFVTHAPDDPDRLFIVRQGSGTTSSILIYNLSTGTLNATPFLNVTGIQVDSEKGALGMAFHPEYETNGKFYVTVSEAGGGASGSTTVREYSVSADPDVANAAFSTVIRAEQPTQWHNGGWIGFGPNDGYLYLATGDGGGGNDPSNNGQNKAAKLGKMLRVDVDGDDFTGGDDPLNVKNYAIPDDNAFSIDAAFAQEIWAYGLRNPWRPSFDSLTGDLWIADVGEKQRDEINFQPADAPAGANYGWRLREGDIQAPAPIGGPEPADHVPPIYAHDQTFGESITGGYRYRGSQVPEFFGKYIFGDFILSRIWTLHFDELGDPVVEQITNDITEDVGTISTISSFGEDANGELYVVDYGGEVFAFGSDRDPADFNGDGTVDLDDFGILSANYHKNAGVVFDHGDTNNDGVVDFSDFSRLVLNFDGENPQVLVPPVPEPAGLVVIAAGGMWLRRRRRAV